MIQFNSKKFMQPPAAPCEKCVDSSGEAGRIIQGSRTIFVVYCEHELAGSILVAEDGQSIGGWRTYSPMGKEQFVDSVVRGLERSGQFPGENVSTSGIRKDIN